MKRRDQEELLNILVGFQQSFDSHLKMIQDLIRLNENLHKRLTHLELIQAEREAAERTWGDASDLS